VYESLANIYYYMLVSNPKSSSDTLIGTALAKLILQINHTIDY